jgi:hypothetical protein
MPKHLLTVLFVIAAIVIVAGALATSMRISGSLISEEFSASPSTEE